MKKILLFMILISTVLIYGNGFALTISAIQSSDTSSISDWISGLGGNVVVLEDFENETTGWYESLVTSVGTFTAGGESGLGATSYNASNDPDSGEPWFSIRDQAWYGRGNTTTTDNASQYLDSGDITELSLDIDDNLDIYNLFFFLQDPSDVRARTTVESESVEYDFSGLSNGSLWFIGIQSDNVLSSITWSTSNRNDGYGLDDFSTVAPVPEPATMLLLGVGLVGLAGVGRKKFFK